MGQCSKLLTGFLFAAASKIVCYSALLYYQSMNRRLLEFCPMPTWCVHETSSTERNEAKRSVERFFRPFSIAAPVCCLNGLFESQLPFKLWADIRLMRVCIQIDIDELLASLFYQFMLSYIVVLYQ